MNTKSFYFKVRFITMLLTLGLGLVCVFISNSIFGRWNEVSVQIPDAELEFLPSILLKEKPTTFNFFGSGCGGINIYGGRGSISAFETDDSQIVNRDSSGYSKTESAENELRMRLEAAAEIIDTKDLKKSGWRVILKTGKENTRYEILRYDGKKSIETFAAPTLKLALEFEKYYLLRTK